MKRKHLRLQYAVNCESSASAGLIQITPPSLFAIDILSLAGYYIDVASIRAGLCLKVD
jgi:hypothetical protein